MVGGSALPQNTNVRDLFPISLSVTEGPYRSTVVRFFPARLTRSLRSTHQGRTRKRNERWGSHEGHQIVEILYATPIIYIQLYRYCNPFFFELEF